MAADSSSNLEIVISAIDEASAAFDEVSASLEGLSEAADASTAEISASMEGSATVITTGTQEIEGSLDAWQAAMFSTGAAAQAMTDEVALSFQEFTASEEAAAEESAAASEEIATSSALTKGSFTSIGVVAALAFAAVASAVSGAVSSAQGWDEESAIISQTLKDTGSAIPLSQVQEYAQHVQSITLLTQQQALQSQGLILSYKDLQPNYQSLTLLSADLATKMSQVSGTMTDNLPNATKILVNALEDPVAGINPLIRQGTVAFPAATVTMIENMAKVGDTAGADALILETLNGKVGGMAQAAAQAPGAGLTQLSNSLTSLGTKLGTIFYRISMPSQRPSSRSLPTSRTGRQNIRSSPKRLLPVLSSSRPFSRSSPSLALSLLRWVGVRRGRRIDRRRSGGSRSSDRRKLANHQG